MVDVELIGVPFDGYGRPGNQALAASVLRAAGLDRLGHGDADADLVLPHGDPRRVTSTSLINEGSLVAMTDALNERVRSALASARFPLVFGGDCSSLLGIVTGLRDHDGSAGLLFVDGHEDTMPLDVSEDGEAANSEIGLLLGLTGRLLGGSLGQRLPALDLRAIALPGQRDQAWRRRFNVGTLHDLGVWSMTADRAATDPSAAGRSAASHVRDNVEHWWFHVDLDVLDPDAMAAQGLPDVPDEPGGLRWDELRALTGGALAIDGCVGLRVAIYDPEQDPDGTDADRTVEFISEAIGTLRHR